MVYLDFETRSLANLQTGGLARYFAHESTEVLCLTVASAQNVMVWVPRRIAPDDMVAGPAPHLWPTSAKQDRPLSLCVSEELPSELLHKCCLGPVVAHNVAFDRSAWERLMRLPAPGVWIDTLPRCRAAGLPGSLDRVGELLGAGRKDEAGKRQMLRLSQGPVSPRLFPARSWEATLRYNVQDVMLLERVYAAVQEWGEADVIDVDEQINRRGFPLDIEFARRLHELWHQHDKQTICKLREVSDGGITEANVRSPLAIRAWLAKRGIVLDSVARANLQAFFDDPEGHPGWIGEHDSADVAKVVEVLRLRAESSKATRHKVARALECVEADGRIRDWAVVYGAHTGRFTGRGFQPQNIARGADKLNLESLVQRGESLQLCDVEREAVLAGTDTATALTTLTRPMIRAIAGKQLCILDFAQVEARGVGWVADESFILNAFADTERDVYVEMASKVFGKPLTKADKAERFIGKEIVLGSGYGMSATRFAAYCETKGLDLAAAGTSAAACIGTYRETAPRVVQTWAALDQLALAAMGAARKLGAERARQVEERARHLAGLGIGFERLSEGLALRLPSGRRILYREARVVEEQVSAATHPRLWAATAASLGEVATRAVFARPRPAVKFTHPRFREVGLFGGMLMDNLVQGICRDLLVHTLTGLDQMCIDVVLHVHDEVVCEVGEREAAIALRRAAEYMSEPPKWAGGFPLRVEGFTNRYYIKAPFSTSHRVDAMCGRLL